MNYIFNTVIILTNSVNKIIYAYTKGADKIIDILTLQLTHDVFLYHIY